MFSPNPYTPRLLEPLARAALEQGKILVLVGPRQTGKSTLARALLAGVSEEEQLSLNLDDPFLRDRLVSEEGALMRVMERKAGRPWSAVRRFYLVVDEAQRAPRLFEILKDLYDRERDRLRLIVTGSSALAIHDPVAESFAGRARILPVLPFSLAEGFAHLRGERPDPVLPELMSRLLRGQFGPEDFEALVTRARWHERERRAFARRQVRHPLYPEPCAEEEPELWLRDYLATYIEKDIQSLTAVGDVALFRACLRQVAARVGSALKWEPAAQEVGTTSVTLRKYVGLMEQTFNLTRLGAFAVSPAARVKRAPKLYLNDAGILWALRDFEDERLLLASGMWGAYVEQLAVAELRKWCALEKTAPELRYWQKTEVSEVDVVLSNRGYHIPFVIKAAERWDSRWLRGLDAFDADHAALGLAIPYRVLLTFGEPAMPDPRTFVLPLWALC